MIIVMKYSIKSNSSNHVRSTHQICMMWDFALKIGLVKYWRKFLQRVCLSKVVFNMEYQNSARKASLMNISLIFNF